MDRFDLICDYSWIFVNIFDISPNLIHLDDPCNIHPTIFWCTQLKDSSTTSNHLNPQSSTIFYQRHLCTVLSFNSYIAGRFYGHLHSAILLSPNILFTNSIPRFILIVTLLRPVSEQVNFLFIFIFFFCGVLLTSLQ